MAVVEERVFHVAALLIVSPLVGEYFLRHCVWAQLVVADQPFYDAQVYLALHPGQGV